VGVGVAGGSGQTVLLIKGVVLNRRRGVERHVARGVVSVVGRAGGVQPVVGVGGGQQALSGTGRLLRRLVGQVAPGVVGVVVAPVRLEAAADGPAAIGSLVPGGKQAVQRVIDKDLTAVVVAVVGDPPDVAVVAAVHVEI